MDFSSFYQLRKEEEEEEDEEEGLRSVCCIRTLYATGGLADSNLLKRIFT